VLMISGAFAAVGVGSIAAQEVVKRANRRLKK